MVKTINEEELTIIIKLKREGGSGPVVVSARGDYRVQSDDLEQTRTLDPLVITAEEETAIKNFGANALTQIQTAESIS